MELPAGATLAHYEILGPLGRGGMGQVFRARDTRLDREVAIKLLPAELSADPGRLQRLEQEARALARLNHPNIVTIYSVEEAAPSTPSTSSGQTGPGQTSPGRASSGPGGTVRFLTMECIEGKTLDEIIGESGLSTDALLRLAVPLATAMAAAHERGIIHRDLKPANVMVTGDGTLKVLDFGLAKVAASGFDAGAGTDGPAASDPDGMTATSYPAPSPVTDAGTVLGTVSYMSPEQGRGEPLDPRSDVFSLGILLYQMATGRLPFQGRTPADTLSSILRDTPPRVNELKAELPNHLGRIVRRCLEKEPENRLQSAADLARELRDLQRELREGSTPSAPAVAATPGAVTPVAATSAATSTGVHAGIDPTGTQISAETSSAPTQPVPQPASRRIGPLALIAAVLVAVVAGVALWRNGFFSGQGEAGAPRATGERSAAAPLADDAAADHDVIVVFPFENLGPAEDAYFAAGIAEEISSRLASVETLGVISRTSAVQYDRAGKTIAAIGVDLGVDYVLDGTVRWARSGGGPSRVRVTPQLIRVADDHQMWSTSFDETLEEIFEVQSRIAENVIHQLDLRLNESEAEALETRPTENLEAYQAYLRGIEARNNAGYSQEIWEESIAMLERSVELDPGFTLAWAALSDAHSYFYHLRYDTSDERIRQARFAVDRALQLDPDSSRARVALGFYHYRCHRDYERAMEEFSISARDLPNDTDLLTGIGAVQRRLGRFEESARTTERALRLDPRDSSLHWDLGVTYATAGQFERAMEKFADAIAIDPEARVGYTLSSWISGIRGDLVESRRWLERAPEGWDPFLEFAWQIVLWFERDYDGLRARLEGVPWEVLEHTTFHAPRSLLLADLDRITGRTESAERNYGEALAWLDRELETRGTDARIHVARGHALAGLGRREEAVAAAERAMKLYPTSLDAFHGPHIERDAAFVYLVTGDYDRCLDLVERLAAGPQKSVFNSIHLQGPWFDEIRDLPRFQELVARYEEDRAP